MLFILLIFASVVNAQIDLPRQSRSAYEGKEFVVGFMQNEILVNSNVDQKLFISSRYNSSVTITTYGETPDVFQLTPNNTLKLVVPTELMVYEEGQKVKKSIRIESQKNISVVGYSSQYMSSDMFAAIPTNKWGKEYQAITMGIDHYNVANQPTNDPVMYAPRSGQFMIVANENNTSVTFTPRANTKTYKGNEPHIITLNKWDTFLIQSEESPTKYRNDLSGSIIRSDKPIGVLSGHMRTAVTPKLDFRWADSKDHLVEMLNPSNLFGKEYVTAPFGQGIKSYYCLTGLKANTKVEITTIDGIEEVLLNFEGDRKYIRIDGAAKWTANNEFQLGQFMARFGDPDEDCLDFYDPAFVIIQPIDYFNNNLNFKAINYNESNYNHNSTLQSCGEIVTSGQYKSHHVMIITKDEARYNTMVDGWNYDVTDFEGTVPGTDYYYGYIQVEPGEHEIYTPEGGFQAIIYGGGYADSYAYSLGGANAPDSLQDFQPLEIAINDVCDEVVFEIFDEGDNSSGIQFIEYLVADNVEINEEIISENERKIIVKHKDKRNNAQVIIDYFDNAGNGRRYVHKFDGIDPVIIDKSLGTIEYDPNTVYSTNLFNNGSSTINIYNVYFDNEEFLLKEQFEEISLAPNQEYEIEFIILTNNVNDLPNEVNLIAESDCYVSDTAKVHLSVASVGFSGKGIDLGGVPLGTEKCGIVYFENQGDLNLKIDNINLSDSEITANLDGILNKNINITERQNIEACVTPMDRNVNVLDIEMTVSATYYGTDSIVNSKTLSDIVSVTYTPLGGIFEDKEYTFDSIFVNQSVQVEFEIVNTGNMESSVSFNKLEDFPNKIMSPKNEGNKFQIEGEYEPDVPKTFTFHFEPTEPGNYENVFHFDYNEGVLERKFSITLKGTAVNSKITPIDNCFEDTVYVGESVTKNFPYLEYEGEIDRDLVIVNRYLSVHTDLNTNVSTTISHNDNAIDFYNGIDHPPVLTDGDIISHVFSFTPTRAGKFELYIISIVNTLTEGKIPPFDSVYSKICGIAAEPILPELEIVIDTEDIWACDTASGNVSITNIGETDVIMEEIEVVSNFFTASTFTKPQILKMGDTYNIPLVLFRFRDEIEELEVFIRATDYIGRHSTTFSEKKLIEPNFTQLILPDLEFNYTIGDSSVVNLYGDIPYDIDVPAKLTIQLEVDYELLWLLSENAELVITSSSGGTQKIPVEIRKSASNPNILEFDIDFFEFDVFPDQRWSIDLSFRVMLASFLDTEFKINVFYDECFENIEKMYPVKVEEVCIQYFRNVDYFDKGDIDLHYDYEKSELFVNLDVPTKSSYSIYLIDMLGKKINIEEKKFVNIGNYFLNYDLKKFPNGNYFLNIETKHLKQRKKIIILK